MSDEDISRSNFWNEATGYCDCCGKQSKTVWGDLGDSSETKAVHFAQWTVDQPLHTPIFDIVLGLWGEGATPKDCVLVSSLYQPRLGGGSFMITSGKARRADSRTFCGRALECTEVIGTPVASEAFSMIDALWLTEPRMEAIRALDGVVQAQV